MHDEHRVTDHKARGMVEGNLHTLVNIFTEGLRDLPTDYATRVKHFLAEYLGGPRHPVPFGGRARDFAHQRMGRGQQVGCGQCRKPAD